MLIGSLLQLKEWEELAPCCARCCVCIICIYAFVWVPVYFLLNLINQVSSTSAITHLARLLFMVSHFYSGLGKLTTYLLFSSGFIFKRNITTYMNGPGLAVGHRLPLVLPYMLGPTPVPVPNTCPENCLNLISPSCEGTLADFKE